MTDREELSLGRLLKDLREAKGLTLRAVEENEGISNAYVSQLENDRISKPSPHILFKLAKLYGVDYGYLMQKAGYIMPSATSNPGHKQRQGGRFFATSAITDLTPEEEEALLEYLAFLRTRRRRKR